MGYTTEQQAKLQFEAKSIVEDAISSLMMIGMAEQNALQLLMIQAAVRMHDNAEIRSTLRSIEEGLVDDDDDDDDDDDEAA